MNESMHVNPDFMRFANKLASATLWAEYFEREGKAAEARQERQLAAFLASAISRRDFRTATPPWQEETVA
jgi:hypothetical protein